MLRSTMLPFTKLKIFVIFTMMLLMFTAARAESVTMKVATGKPDGFYHTGLYSTFAGAMARITDKEVDMEYYADKGTDGTKHNIQLVNTGKADIAFVQLDGTVIEAGPNVEVIGTIMYELAHLVVPKKGKVDDLGDLDSGKKYSIGMNLRSGSVITWDSMIKQDSDYKSASPMDFEQAPRALAAMVQGNLDSYFFVSAPGTTNISRINESSDVVFADCWDGDFDKFKVNGKELYTKVKVGPNQGYKNKFVTFRVPAVVIANKQFLADNPDVFTYLFDATSMTYKAVKGQKKLNYYPED